MSAAVAHGGGGPEEALLYGAHPCVLLSRIGSKCEPWL